MLNRICQYLELILLIFIDLTFIDDRVLNVVSQRMKQSINMNKIKKIYK